jgi:hypothetical protein
MGFSAQSLDAFNRWPAYMASHLTNRKGRSGSGSPVIVQRDYDCPEGVLPAVSGLGAGTVVGFTYFDFGAEPLAGARVSLEISPASRGRIDVVLDDPLSAQVVATVEIDGPKREWASFAAPMPAVSGVHAVYLIARPEGRMLGDLSYLAFVSGV